MDDNHRHTFFVDDELKVCRVVAETLKQIDAGITCFSCASDYLEQLGSQKCNLVITDLRMPKMNGMELLRRAKVVTPWLEMTRFRRVH